MDVLSEDGANHLADKITSLWHKRGYPGIKTEVVKCDRLKKGDGTKTDPVYVVRSNLINGYPPLAA